jgi:uncharacterized protein YgfB (UPF0149 family)
MAVTTYSELVQALNLPGVGLAPAEAHGALCGALCAMPGYGVDDWIGEVLPETAASAPVRALLTSVYTRTRDELVGLMFEFAPLLPDDEVLLAERVAALADWCGGFLYGLGVGRIAAADQLAGDVGEIIKDFSEISRAELSAKDGIEENEAAFAELVEFIRAGTLVVFEELAPARDRVAVPAGGLH